MRICLLVPQAPGFEAVLRRGHRKQTLLFGDEIQNYLFPHDLGFITGEGKLNAHSVQDEEIKPCRVFGIVFKESKRQGRKTEELQKPKNHKPMTFSLKTF